MSRTCLGILLLLGACSYSVNYVDSEIETEPVQLQISNGDIGAGLRCLVSMAHYITYDPPVIAPGKRLNIDLLRGVASNTLYFTQAGTSLMAVENIFCGQHTNWFESMFNLNLAALRSDGFHDLSIHCGNVDNALSCATASAK